MQFAVNYSVPLERLILSGQLKPDLIKCPDWLNIICHAQKIARCYTHNEIALGISSLRQLDFKHIRHCLELTGTPHLNCHLWGSLPAYGTEAQQNMQLDIWMRDLDFLRQNLPDYEIICENLPAQPTQPLWKVSFFPELIARFIRQSETGLLLDLSHARITASNSGTDYQAYIAALPTDRLRELHITGIRSFSGALEDHFEMQPQDWQPAAWAAEQISSGIWNTPRIVAFEYGGVGDKFNWRTDENFLLEQVPRLAQLFLSAA